MSRPTPHEVAVATGALRIEAGEWDEQSAALGAIAGKVGGMELGRVEAGLFQLVVSPYNEVVHQVQARCQEGQTAMTEIAETLRSVADTYDQLLDLFIDILKGAIAPIYMFSDAWSWMDVRGSATGISSSLSEQNLVVDNSDWSGAGHQAYVTAAKAQSQAAARIGSIAGSTSNHLLACAVAGAAFYVTVAAVIVKLVAAAAAALAAFGSAVFSWAGAAIVLEEASVNTAIIWTAIGTLTAFLSAQATAMVTLHGEAVDLTSFPEGHWPKSQTSSW